MNNFDIKDLVGQTIIDIAGATPQSEEVILRLASGERIEMWHERDCCESVYLVDVVGDTADLLGVPLVVAEAAHSMEGDQPEPPEGADSSQTWTFYKFATAKGYVTLRWFGSSNGYYSETVSARLIPAPDTAN